VIQISDAYPAKNSGDGKSKDNPKDGTELVCLFHCHPHRFGNVYRKRFLSDITKRSNCQANFEISTKDPTAPISCRWDGMARGEERRESLFKPPQEKVTTCRRSPFRQDTRHFSDSGTTGPLLKMFMTFTPFTYANEQEAGFSAPAHTMRATP
jgi:hypothetical protein